MKMHLWMANTIHHFIGVKPEVTISARVPNLH